MANDAIAAIATPHGRGGIGVVRVSGPGLEPTLRALAGRDVRPRQATRADFLDAAGAVIDQGLILYFRAPHSYTGEDVIELQGHGGPVVLNLLLQRCLELGARLAEPGEFTKRAFLNDKIDLAQAEGVADLIDAATAQAARCAMRSLQGDFSRHIEALVDALTELRIFVEATLDFPDEEVEFLESGKVRARLAAIRAQLAAIIAASQQGQLLRDGIHVVLTGQPNVGKSSLLNALAGTERAIVTEIPGTTRDLIRETINLHGVPLHVIDTAGLREPRDPVEKIGIERTWQAVAAADLVLWVSDLTRPETCVPDPALGVRTTAGVPQLHALNKVDLAGLEPCVRTISGMVEVAVSAKSGAGLDLLKAAVLAAAGWDVANEGVFMARERHLQALQLAQEHVNQAAGQSQVEFLAEELKLAQRALGGITGEITADDLLGKIFSHFCIGK
ncbi:MAG TPA: tRNA uridine-5-carboxymethylaminomethyl(34) synthesis GTPase MnmE [Burkholderiales bacterium]|nr:tRNA uridine-5-carboxymethylaminomethyl(34) synthesis GTPase MnmE [Burkholderiales bacterium]